MRNDFKVMAMRTFKKRKAGIRRSALDHTLNIRINARTKRFLNDFRVFQQFRKMIRKNFLNDIFIKINKVIFTKKNKFFHHHFRSQNNITNRMIPRYNNRICFRIRIKKSQKATNIQYSELCNMKGYAIIPFIRNEGCR